MNKYWQVVTHWADDRGRAWAGTVYFTDKNQAIAEFAQTKRDNRDVRDITVDLLEYDGRFPFQVTSWTTTQPSTDPPAPLQTAVARLARRFKIVDG